MFKREASFENQISKWQFIKYKCREACRIYSIQKSKERSARRVELEKKLTDLERLPRTNSTENIREEYDICQSEFDDYMTAGIVMRSKSSWYEHGEISSKYFLNLEKCNKAKSHVRSLISESGIQMNDPTEIMSKVRDFYSKLYTRRSTKTEKECLDYLSRLHIPRLRKSDRDSCEGMLTKKECWEALNAMQNGKSPGNDGLTKEFYVCFLNEISDSLVAALNRSFEVSQLSLSQRQAAIVLIDKKDKDKRLIKSWRLISLINVDSKIASKALASRMKTVLNNIIKCDQTAYVKGRYIGESIRLVTDILEHMER